jgi:hypothetical protein
MRRWVTAAALGCVAALALTGCGNPAGTDGDLTDDWGAFGTPVGFVPKADTCHEYAGSGFLSSYHPIDCGQPHKAETIYVGTFTGANTSWPEAESTSMRTMRADCDKRIDAALGGDWRTARLTVMVVPATARAWDGGARWYRCDVGETDKDDANGPITRTGSLKGALKTPSDLNYRCSEPRMAGDDVTSMHPVACAAKHHSEFAGIYTAPNTPYDVFNKDEARTSQGCKSVIAAFAKVPNDSNLQYRTGWIYFSPDETAWAEGERGVQCFVWISDRNLTRSVSGAGNKGLPIK